MDNLNFKSFLAVFLGLFFLIGGAYLVSFWLFASQKQEEAEILLQEVYQMTDWQGVGSVFEPLLELPVVYSQGVKKTSFLVDSGALVSSLPREEAGNLGYDSLAKLKRTVFAGYNNQLAFAYLGEMAVMVGEERVSLPVVFTEAMGTKRLLGRAGFFEEYSVFFNARDRRVEVREK